MKKNTPPGRAKRRSRTMHRTAPRTSRTRRGTKRWSTRVTAKSDALTLDDKVFCLRSPRAIAASLKRSADRSRRRKSTPFRSAMSMLNFYVNRAGRNLPASRKRTLEQAKDRLRALYGR